MPTLLQASISSVPAGAVTFLPSTVMFTSGIVCQFGKMFWSSQHRQLIHYEVFLKGTRPAFQMVLEFLSKLFNNGNRRHGCGIAQRTEGASQHVFRQVLNVVDVLLHAAPSMKAGQRFFQPIRTLAAWNAPAATFMLIKLHDAKRKFHHAHSFIHYNDPARTQKRTRFQKG